MNEQNLDVATMENFLFSFPFSKYSLAPKIDDDTERI